MHACMHAYIHTYIHTYGHIQRCWQSRVSHHCKPMLLADLTVSSLGVLDFWGRSKACSIVTWCCEGFGAAWDSGRRGSEGFRVEVSLLTELWLQGDRAVSGSGLGVPLNPTSGFRVQARSHTKGSRNKDQRAVVAGDVPLCCLWCLFTLLLQG